MPSAVADDSPLSVSEIKAVFVPSELATHYTVEVADLALGAGQKITYHWSLQLQLVDKADTPDPQLPGSGAAVDPACSNHGHLTSSADEFVWHHGDAPIDNCDHNKMGPSGHQGLISVVVSDGKWSCHAVYKGTNSSPAATQGKARCFEVDHIEKAATAAIATIRGAIGDEKAALKDLEADPPKLNAADENIRKGRLALSQAQRDLAEVGVTDGGTFIGEAAYFDDLEVQWNMNVHNSPHVPHSPLDVALDRSRLEQALAIKQSVIGVCSAAA